MDASPGLEMDLLALTARRSRAFGDVDQGAGSHYQLCGLSSLDELAYVVGLVRQALERQMGNGADA